MKTGLSRVLALLMMILMMTVSAALAQTEEAFILSCDDKTSKEAELYQRSVDSKKRVSYTAEGTLPAGVYLQATGRQDAEKGYMEYTYFHDGEYGTSWIRKDSVADAWMKIFFLDGSCVKLHERIASDPQAVSQYCQTYFPGREYTFDAAAGNYDATLSAEEVAKHLGEGSVAMGVKLVQPGVSTSLVTLQGIEVEVASSGLSIGENQDARHMIGVVLAPNTGEASVRETASGNGKVLVKAKTGRVVAVQEYTGSTYTKIWYEGKERYIRTDCLVFPKLDQTPLGVGMLRKDGKTDGEKKINIHTKDSDATAKVASWPTGTEVTVLSEDGDWYIVEKDGWYGYVLDEYLTLISE